MKRGSLAEERPELVAQWARINTLSPADISCGSHKKVWWVCEKGHTWESTVKNRALIGSGCPYCEHRAVLKGYNDLQTVFRFRMTYIYVTQFPLGFFPKTNC